MKVSWFFLLIFWGSAAFTAKLQGVVVESEDARWVGGIVPYVIDKRLSVGKQKAILKAMALWESETVVTFLPVTPDNQENYPDYVIFQKNKGKTCASSVGMQGGKQAVKLAERCNTMMIAHELGHLLGLWHEQARLDRDAYLEVVWENIKDGHYHNFDKRVEEGKNQGAYDYDSIMHYSDKAFSKNGEPTLVPRMQGVKIGQRTHLSAGDIASVNALYLSDTKEE